MDARALVVEDDRSIRELTRLGLTDAGFSVVTAADGDEGLSQFRELRPDVVILDVMLPRRDGLEVLKAIRAESTTPVIMVTARDTTTDVVVGLELGADDYVTKPFEMPILVARVRAAVRRGAPTTETDVAHLSDLRIDPEAHTVSRDGDDISLTATEFRLLVVLASRPGQVFTREILLDRVWGYSYLGDSRLVDVAIQRLRSKIEPNPARPAIIETVRGVGYRAKPASDSRTP